MFKYRLHPVSALINFFKGLKELLLPFVIIIITSGGIVINPNDPDFWPSLIPKLFLGVALIFVLYIGIVKWRTYMYWFEDDELRVEYGLFVKKKRYVPFERIQSLNYKEGIFHRMFKLVAVDIETAGNSTEAEISLTAITREQANRIEHEMKEAKKRLQAVVVDEHGVEIVEEEVVAPEHVIHAMDQKDLILLASTSGGVGVVLAGILAVFSQVSAYIPYEKIYKEISSVVSIGFALLASVIAAAFIITWLISVLMTFINYYNFKVVEQDGKMIITRGLLEKKRTTIPLSRIQGVRIVENPLRQPFGYATVLVESASGGDDDNKIASKTNLFPLIKRNEIAEKLAHVLPQYTMDTPMTSSPKRAIPFFYRFDLVYVVPIIAALSYFFYPYGLFSLLLIVAFMLLGRWQWRSAAFAIDGSQLTIRSRFLSRTTFIVQKNRIQSMEARQSYFEQRRDVASVGITVMSGFGGSGAAAMHIETQHADMLLSWFERERRNEIEQ